MIEFLKAWLMGLLAAVGLVYLLAPPGSTDVIPDDVPWIGHLDELAAAFLLVAFLEYAGVNLFRAFRQGKKANEE